MRASLLLILTLALAGSAIAADRCDEAACSRIAAPGQAIVDCSSTDREMWNVLFSFETTSSSQGGVATDGDHIYTCSFSTEMFRRFEMDGTFVEEFTIPGISTMSCMTFDGTDFYGARGPLEDGIARLDLENHLLLNTIPVSAPSIVGIGHISYDPELGRDGGFWIGYWWELAAVDMDGIEIIPNITTPGGCAGSAYDNVSDPANPCLYLFLQTGASNLEFYKFDINSQTYSGVLHVATDIPAPSWSAVASGCDSYINRDGKLVLLGMIDRFPENEVVFGYEIADAFIYTNDISVQSLVSPVSGDALGSAEEVTVKLLNNGTVTQTGFDIQYSVDDGGGPVGPFTKTVTASLGAGEFTSVTFDETADLSLAGTDYVFTITALLAGDENPENDVLVKTVRNTEGVYCFASGAGGSEYISNVSMGDVSNSSGDDHYTDYTNDPGLHIVLESGVSTQLTITIGNPYNANVGAVWIDWNDDGDFYDDGAEFISAFGQGPYVTLVTPPAYALEETNLRMRIRLDYNNPQPNPCGSTSFGEVEDYTVIVSDETGAGESPVVLAIALGVNCPNPFNPTTTISFITTDPSARTRIYVTDLQGREVSTIVDEVLPAGRHSAVWNGTNSSEEPVASGVYFCRMVSGDQTRSGKMTLLK